MSIADLRKDYTVGGLEEADVDADPIKQFALWFEQARLVTGHEANAMTVATASAEGVPAARILLMKGFDEQGFTFYTNYESEKGLDLAANPAVALMFYWPELERQIRISGKAEQLPRADSERYFHSRPRGSQIGAAASKQSTVIPDRQYLADTARALEERFEGQDVPLPDNWGGYLVRPNWMEFWQGRSSRLHDRLRYLKAASGVWSIVRLSP